MSPLPPKGGKGVVAGGVAVAKQFSLDFAVSYQIDGVELVVGADKLNLSDLTLACDFILYQLFHQTTSIVDFACILRMFEMF